MALAELSPLLADEPRDLWAAVNRLIDRATRLEDLRHHGLQLLAGQRWRALGRPLEPLLVHDEQLAAAVTLTVPLVLERVRVAYEGPIVVMKGPEVAALYPLPRLRPYGDIDLLVDNAERAQRALLAAGFLPVGDPSLFVDIHHLRPLLAPGAAIAVEVHDRPKWPDGFVAPPLEELLARAEAAATAGDLLALPRAEHALLIAAHAWAHMPLGRISQLLDADLMAAGCEPDELRALARRWGIERIWHATSVAADALFRDGASSWPVRSWARNLPTVRERTVLEWHLEALFAPFSAARPLRAFHASMSALVQTVRPEPGEAWRDKLTRTGRALRSPAVRLSDHRRALDDRDRRAS